MSNLQVSMTDVFKFEGKKMDVLADEELEKDILGDFLMSAKQVGDALGYARPGKAVSDHVDQEDSFLLKISDILKQDFRNLNNRGEKFINESGIYALVFGSKLDKAKKFKRWVTKEVLPAIRKTGSYSVENQTSDKEIAVKEKEIGLKAVDKVDDIVAGLDIDEVSIATEKQRIMQQSGFDINLSLPAGFEFITAEEVANKVGIYSKSGKPHSQAVGAILEDIGLDEDMKRNTLGSNGSHQYSHTQYNEKVVEKVGNWLSNYGYPTRIDVDCRNCGYNVKYE